MSAAVLTQRPRVQIGSTRGSAVIGRGANRIVLAQPPAVLLHGRAARVEVAGPARLAIVGGRQGIAGPPGEGIEIEIYQAAANLGGHRAVALDSEGRIIYASAALEVPGIGIIRDAVALGETVAVHRRGRVGGFTGLTPSAVYYLGDTGLLSLTPPGSGVLQPLGTAASATELLVEPDYPTFL